MGCEEGVFWGLGLGGVDRGFVTARHPPVPAAVALLLLNAGVVPRLVAGIAEVGQHVRPKALILRGHQAGQVVAGFDLQRQRRDVQANVTDERAARADGTIPTRCRTEAACFAGILADAPVPSIICGEMCRAHTADGLLWVPCRRCARVVTGTNASLG